MAKRSLALLVGLPLILGMFFLGETYGGACAPEGVCMDYVDGTIDVLFDGGIVVDGDISEWPANAKVGDLWVADQPPIDVGDVYLKHDDEFFYIGVATDCPDITLHHHGEFVRFDTTEAGELDGCVDIQDNDGNSKKKPCKLSTQFARGECAYEYAFRLDEIGLLDPGECFGFFAHAEIRGFNNGSETATFPPRPVGDFKFITACLTRDTTDTIPPVITCPDDRVLECEGPDGAYVDGLIATAVDDQDPNPVITNDYNDGGADASDYYPIGTTVVTFTAEDNAGNTSSCQVTVEVVDTTPPELHGVPGDLTVECDAVPVPPEVTATDGCDPNPIVEFNEVRTNGPCDDEYTLTRTWTATDAYGNSVSESQVVTVVDTTPPVISGVPEGGTVECDEIPAPGEVTATDNCDPDPELVYSEVRTDGSCDDEYRLTRTWTATDRCGNSSSGSQVIQVVDTTPPVISGVPEGGTVECDAVPAPAEVTATDNCDPDPELVYSEVRTDGSCEDEYTLTRTWTATDRCGNSSSGTQVITVEDTTPPELSGVPGDITVECDAVPDPPTVTATDNCDPDPELVFSEVRTDGSCEDEYTLTRTWTATDRCGNSSSATQIINVVDTTPPEVTCPDDLDFQCAFEVPDPDPSDAAATDNCDGSVDITVSESDNGGEGCVDDPLIITWTYTATDNCGNQSACDQIITVIDTTPPEITCPDDVIVDPDPGECGTSAGNVDLGTAEASDNCGEVTVTNDAPGTFPVGVTIVTWTATDACGNASTCTQFVTVRMHVDVKPMSCPNPLQTQSGSANIPFAILGCDGFDVTQIDWSTVRVEGVAPIQKKFAFEDVTQPVPDRLDSCDCTTLGGDGYTDLTFKVRRNSLVNALEDRLGRPLEDGEVLAVYVTANLKEEFGGGALAGMDCMIVNTRGGGPQAALTARFGPKTFGLGQNRPNPLHGTTIINYQLPTTGSVSLKIYDTSGRLVNTLASGIREPGYYTEMWDATDQRGYSVPNGVYFYTLRAGTYIFTKQMILIR